MPRSFGIALVSAAAFGPPLSLAQEAIGHTADADALAKQLSNPVASLVSVPLQLNYDSGYGSGGDGERWTLNIQPVAPFSISEDWNVISRTILPIIHQDGVVGDDSDSGTGDTIQS
ncbi:MAG: transporter, partial [Steroidobacteraceae bacterium]